jgi:hypothetical protein
VLPIAPQILTAAPHSSPANLLLYAKPSLLSVANVAHSCTLKIAWVDRQWSFAILACMKHKRVQAASAVPVLATGLFFAVLPVQAQEPASNRSAPDFETSLMARCGTPAYPDVTKLRQTVGSVNQY